MDLGSPLFDLGNVLYTQTGVIVIENISDVSPSYLVFVERKAFADWLQSRVQLKINEIFKTWDEHFSGQRTSLAVPGEPVVVEAVVSDEVKVVS